MSAGLAWARLSWGWRGAHQQTGALAVTAAQPTGVRGMELRLALGCMGTGRSHVPRGWSQWRS